MIIRKLFQHRLVKKVKEEYVTSLVFKAINEHQEVGFYFSPTKTGKDVEKVMASLGGRRVRWVSSYFMLGMQINTSFLESKLPSYQRP